MSLTVAATFLGIDRRALNHFIAAGRIPVYEHGRMRKVKVVDVIALPEQDQPLVVGRAPETAP